MDLHRLRPADWLTGLAGLALLLLLFAPWYTLPDGSYNGWQAFGLTDVWFVLTAALAIAVLVTTATRESPSIPIAMDVLCATAATVALVLAVVRLLAVPHGDVVTGREWGVFAGALAVLALNVGAWWAMRDERAPHLKPGPEVRTMPTPPAQGPADTAA